MSDSIQTFASLVLGTAFVGSVLFLEQNSKEHFATETMSGKSQMAEMRARYMAAQNNQDYSDGSYPNVKQFYSQDQRRAQNQFAQMANTGHAVGNTRAYAGPRGDIPQSQANINLNASGDQELAYQLYQQSVNASTPTLSQLNSISGNSDQQTGNNSPLQGGVSSDFAPYSILGGSGPDLYNSEYQAVNLGNPRAEQISACAQNAPTFVATSLLPKPMVPGQDSWNIGAPQDITANQNFLSASQQMGVDTVLGSNRNASHDLRQTIPNPISVVSPWMNTTILPDLMRRSLDGFVPSDGLYGSNVQPVGTYVGMSD